MRWQSGPLEIATREKAGGLTQEVRKTLERWHDPASLDLLANTPVDCLVLSWAAGLPEDAAQWKTAAPLVEAARKRNLAIVGWVDGVAGHNEAVAAAKTAGLTAVAIQGFKGKSDLPVIAWGERPKAPWDTTAPVLPVTDNVWPGVRATGGESDAEAGPTSLPWLDSNGWYVQMARARTQTPVWLMFDPPGKGAVIPAPSYPMAVADSEAAGGRWVISLDDSLRAGLVAGEAAALRTWKTTAAAAAFFEKHREWRAYRSLGLVGVISDFTGEHFDLSGELLNLMARRDLLFRVIWKSQALAQPFTGLKALVYADNTPPAPELRKKIVAFVEQGGLLIAGPKWGPEGKAGAVASHPRFDMRALGKGKLAVATEDMVDAYQVVSDAQVLVSHANDLVRYYNSSSSGCTVYTASPDGKKVLMQGLSYASARQGGLMSVWVERKYRSARVWSIDAAEPAPIGATPAEDFSGEEYHMPTTASQGYVALEFEV